MRPLALIAVVLMCVAAPLRAADEAPPRTVNTSGEATIYVVPDEVVISVGVQTFDKDLDRSKADNDGRSETLLQAVRDLGIEEKYIQTDTMTISLCYDPQKPEHAIAGYICNRSYSITLKDTKVLPKVIDAALKNGANELGDVDFKTTELRKYRDEARKLAIKAAREKAVLLATELQANVGKPRTISESAGYYYYNYFRGNSRFGGLSQNAVQEAPAAGGGDDGSVVPLGQITVSASVSVTFDLE